jgi:hypothetical protein
MKNSSEITDLNNVTQDFSFDVPINQSPINQSPINQ